MVLGPAGELINRLNNDCVATEDMRQSIRK